jgi:hypothetical protein
VLQPDYLVENAIVVLQLAHYTCDRRLTRRLGQEFRADEYYEVSGLAFEIPNLLSGPVTAVFPFRRNDFRLKVELIKAADAA